MGLLCLHEFDGRTTIVRSLIEVSVAYGKTPEGARQTRPSSNIGTVRGSRQGCNRGSKDACEAWHKLNAARAASINSAAPTSDIGQELLQCRTLESGAGECAVVVTAGDQPLNTQTG